MDGTFDTDNEEQDTGLPDNRTVDEKAESLVKRVRDARKQANQKLGSWRKEARDDFAFLAGNQWSDTEKAKLIELSRVDVVFNRIEPVIESVAGHEINNRQAVKYVPRQPTTDNMVNELLTNAADWVRDKCDAEDEESDAFIDMLACGVGVTETTLDYDENPDGEIVINRVDPLTVRWDPSTRKRNLADASWVQHDRKMTAAEIRAEWPDKADEITAMETLDEEDDADELGVDEPHDATDATSYKKDQNDRDTVKKYRTVIAHQWFDNEPYWRTVDPTTNQITELSDEEYQRVLQAAQQGLTAPPTQSVRLKKRIYKTAHVCGDVLLDAIESPSQKGFSLSFMTGRRDRNKNDWYGLVRPMRDPQKFANKYLSQLEALIRSNAKGGLLIEDGATDNLRELEEKWAEQDSVIRLTDGALSGNKVQPKPVSPLPQGPEKLLDFSINSIRDVTGVNLEALGLADRNQPGIVEMQRRESALTILAPLFNSLRRYRKVQGRVLADLIIRFISDGRLMRIVQGDGTEASIPLIRLPETMDYDVVVDSSSNAPDQKQKTFAVMGTLIPALEKSGFPTPPEILDYAPLPQTLVQKWKAAIMQKLQSPPPPPPEVMKAQIQAQADMAKAQMADQTKRFIADLDAKLEMYKTSLKAQSDAQAEQLRAAINEQSQIINAHANEQKSLADTMKARLDGLAKIVDATAKVRAQAEKAIEKGTRGPNVVAFPMPSDNSNNELQTQALAQMSQAVAALTQSLQRPKRVIRDAAGNIQGVQ